MTDKIRCLFIDDNPADVDYILERLAGHQPDLIEIASENNLASGIRRLKEDGSYDAVLLDLSLPDVNRGATVIRMRKASPRIPIVVLTGSSDSTLWLKALEDGAQDYLVKGAITADTLIRALRYAIVRKQLDTMKNDFIHMITHELTTPIRTIAESLELLAKKRPGPTHVAGMSLEEEDFLGMARRNAERLSRLTSDLIDLARFESGQFGIQPKQVDMVELAESARRNIEISAECRIHRTDPGHPVRAFVDPQRMEQVIENLLKNAVRFARTHATIQIAETAGGVRVAVEDDGPGIDPADLPRLFDAFYRGQNGGKGKSGSGLGLTIVRSIVHAHGGRVSVEQPSGSGARFVVELPKSGS